MRRYTRHILLLFILIGPGAASRVPAIDSDSFNPYATGADAGSNAASGGFRPGDGLNLPLPTLIGVLLLVPGIIGSAYWKLKENKSRGSASS